MEDKLCKCGQCKPAAIFVRSASCPSTAAPSPRDIYQYVFFLFPFSLLGFMQLDGWGGLSAAARCRLPGAAWGPVALLWPQPCGRCPPAADSCLPHTPRGPFTLLLCLPSTSAAFLSLTHWPRGCLWPLGGSRCWAVFLWIIIWSVLCSALQCHMSVRVSAPGGGEGLFSSCEVGGGSTGGGAEVWTL